MSFVVHQIISPTMFLSKIRHNILGKTIPEFTLGEKLKMAWSWILKNSQALYPPPKRNACYAIFSKNDITCIRANVFSDIF